MKNLILPLLYSTLLLLIGCSETSQPPIADEATLNATIQNNKIEAQKAKEAYQKLQQRRNQMR